ncbi:DUF305 domain-containing protein [Kaistella faecalis]|uniref:DUF305 domain-containing protein n=1 Tax=Kaistella faecalis TaxID=2852098 RepID=UPI001C472F61|nr:DUF305 domain-containing protein [Chryseobacterium faecale]UFK97680.1 DUF305 domain-containing protein [Chryseobacterium faecale]
MRNIFVPIIASFLVVSCSKTETKIQDHSTEQNQKNETTNGMVAIMNEMMDEMHSEKPTGNNDVDFAKMMIEHHKGAVEMSELLLEKGQDEELKTFARKVIIAQDKEINLMKKFENQTEVSPDSKIFQQELNQSMGAMMNKNIKIHNDIDKDYAEQMIPHHQSAVDMAEVYLKYGKQKDLLKLCDDIVNTQTSEIQQLKTWLTAN